MGGMKVSELDFVRLLPAFMRDDEAAIALSKAMNRLIGEPSKRLKTLRVWDNIDNLNEADHDGNVGDVKIFDRMLNGFKVAYDGSAKKATIKLRIKGGM